MYLVTFCSCVRTFLITGSRREERWLCPYEIHWMMAGLAVAFFVICTFDVKIGLLHDFYAFAESSDPAHEPHNIADRINTLTQVDGKSVNQDTAVVLGDTVLVRELVVNTDEHGEDHYYKSTGVESYTDSASRSSFRFLLYTLIADLQRYPCRADLACRKAERKQKIHYGTVLSVGDDCKQLESYPTSFSLGILQGVIDKLLFDYDKKTTIIELSRVGNIMKLIDFGQSGGMRSTTRSNLPQSGIYPNVIAITKRLWNLIGTSP
ncbi:hypothetical protein P691DRAFT_780912 [Macrolepiota fuliginosa MF-IS2]|uniref:Uncharacterized protein n=1 Tax=Macrolepiota fuliginosa MF-IS2 TaxID=1400762 RepID=A0A9P5XM78_9AGAR|nr:hypothetical protein P691DRAFT_780912 [Macrolepiota fuliginosa MF-IS2]